MVFGALVASSLALASGIAVNGPYKTTLKKYSDVVSMDTTDQQINVWYPKDMPAGKKVPLISYAHGLGGGGLTQRIAYEELLNGVASFGYVIVAPTSCNYGCSDKAALPSDPSGFKNYYKEQLKAIDWARNLTAVGEAPFDLVDGTAGVGIAGHSMGGQATVYSASAAGAGYDIRAAVMHHAYTHSYPAPTVPFLAFTGTKDTTAPPKMTEGFYEAEGAFPVRGLVNKIGATHHEPDVTDYNKLVAPYTAAWFKVFLDETPQADGLDYHEMLFGSGEDSLCGGGDGDMQQCELHDASSAVV